ncbi:MAG TPA: hypothetical protein VNW92_17455 [Polyangiaceae bacterium]|nr:hypothetical protein [Polyangiaceae bacterium]
MTIRFPSWGMGLVAFSVSVSAFARDAAPAQGATAEMTPGATSAGSADSVGFADKKYRLGLRLGYALPLGYVDSRNKLSTAVSGQVPIWIDAGYMLSPNILVGLYGQYGFVQSRYCYGCSTHDIRLGVQGQYHLMPAASADPWLALGVGYEVLSTAYSVYTADLNGFEFLNLQAGADFKVANLLAMGPFVSFSLGKYSSQSTNDPRSDPFPDRGSTTSMHEWLALGVKGTFAL